MIDIFNIDCSEFIKCLQDDSIDLTIADPPYVLSNEKWDKEDIFTSSLISELYRVLKPTSNLYVWCGIGEKSQSLIRWFPLLCEKFYFKDLITWKKQRGIGMRKGWLYTREEIMWFVKDNKKFTWNEKEQYCNEKRPWSIVKRGGKLVNKSEYKRITNVWTDIFEDGFGHSPQSYSKNRFHSTPKPLKAIERIVSLHTAEGDLVFDPFTGTGSTAIVCKKLNRNFIGCELDINFVNIAKRRLEIESHTS